MPTDDELRRQAVKAIKKKRNFWGLAVGYAIVNIVLIVIWYISGGGYFWPGWVLLGWGVGLAFTAWDAYGRGGRGDSISEAEIQKEIERQKRG